MLHDDLLNLDYKKELNYLIESKKRGGDPALLKSMVLMSFIFKETLKEKGQVGKFYFDHMDFDEDKNLLETGWDFLKNNFMDFPFDCCLFTLSNHYEDTDSPCFLVVKKMDENSKSLLLEFLKLSGLTKMVSFIDNASYFYMEAIKYKDKISFIPYVGFINKDLEEKDRRIFSVSLLEETRKQSNTSAGAIVSCLMLLNSKYAEKTNYIVPEKVNKKREKAGKPLLSDCSLIRIGKEYRSQFGSGPHGSPRAHWRRGHSRTLASGKKIPIAPMLINWDGKDIPNKGIYLK